MTNNKIALKKRLSADIKYYAEQYLERNLKGRVDDYQAYIVNEMAALETFATAIEEYCKARAKNHECSIEIKQTFTTKE